MSSPPASGDYTTRGGKLEFKKHEPDPEAIKAQEAAERSGFVKGFAGGMNAYERHKKFINDYVIFYGKEAEYFKPTRPHKTDYDVLREEYRFIRTDEDNDDSQFEKRMSKKYYDKLFKEYCLADLSRYKHGQIGLRWRTEKEVFVGKGQFICGNKKCDNRDNLNSYELPFAYVEAGEQKNALVKLRACPGCAAMVTYYHNKKNQKRIKKEGEEEETKSQITDKDHPSGSKRRRADKEKEKQDKRARTSGETTTKKEERSDSEEEAPASTAANPWKAKAEVEKTKDEEFEEYFEGLFP